MYNKMEPVPLHPAQENICFEQILNPTSSLHNLGLQQKVNIDLDFNTIKTAWQYLHRSLDALRMVLIPSENGEIKQYVKSLESLEPEVIYLDFSEKLDSERLAQNWMQDKMNSQMEWGERHLCELALIKVEDGACYLFSRFHHVIMDGMSLYRLHEWLHRLYISIRDEDSLDWLQSLPQYSEELEKSQKYLESDAFLEDKKYWEDSSRNRQFTRLPWRFNESGGGVLSIDLPSDVSAVVRQFSKDSNWLTLSLLASSVNLFFSQYLEQEEIVIGTAVHGREGLDSRLVVGMHSNVVPFTSSVSDTLKICDLLDSTALEIKKLSKHRRFPTSQISRLNKSGETNLCDIQIVYDAFNSQFTSDYNIDTHIMSSQSESRPLLIRLQNYDQDSNLKLRITYLKQYFDSEEIRLLSERLLQLFSFCIANPQHVVADAPLILESEREKVLRGQNVQDNVNDRFDTIHQLFEDVAAKHSNEIALVFENTEITYGQLNARANRVAVEIRNQYISALNHVKEAPKKGVKSDFFVALYFDRGIDMVIAILAVLKAGGAYIPLDPVSIKERLKYVLKDSEASLILTQSHYKSELETIVEENGFLTSVSLLSDGEQNKNLNPIASSNHLAYVIYTSGTTGGPKGVMVNHANLRSLAFAQQDAFCATDYQCALFFASYVFDASVSELFVSFASAHKIVICSENERRDPSLLEQLIDQQQVELATIPPALLPQLKPERIQSIKCLVTAGETPLLESLQRFKSVCKVLNAYGPTEATVCASVNAFSHGDSESNIGHAITNSLLYVLDKNGKLVPTGCPGELYIGGKGVAQGYLNKKSLTAEKFVPNTFLEDSDGLLYRTGDSVRMLSDGRLEFIGRNDFQVSVRGYRVELGEIESTIGRFEHVSQTCVIDRKRKANQTEIIAYFSWKEADQSDQEIVEKWDSVFDQYYGIKEGEINKFDISGWNSSFTGQAIPEEEMLEWVNQTVKRIRSNSPKHIVEIGSGSGLLMYPLVTECDSYTGFDVSLSAVKNLNAGIRQFDIKNADVNHKVAHDILFSDLRNEVDTIVINSVIQYFPSESYLDDVLDRCIRALSAGTIFIGDVRDLRLHEAFLAQIEQSQSPGIENDHLLEAIRTNAELEEELLVHPCYFLNLKNKYKNVKSVELIPKQDKFDNEMSLYRFDVILHIDSAISEKLDLSTFKVETVPYESIDKECFLNDLKIFKNVFCITGYPNSRIHNQIRFIKSITQAESHELNDIQYLNDKPEPVIAIEELQKAAELNDYSLRVFLNTACDNNSALLDLVFYKDESDLHKYLSSVRDDRKSNDDLVLCNTPYVSNNKRFERINKLRGFLETQLPDYMLPNQYVELTSFPVTVNGKIDRKSLPEPTYVADEGYLAPVTDIQRKLCRIWQDILGLEKIGIRDNFFRIGGNSIVALQLTSRCEKELNIELSVSSLFEQKTIENISSSIEETKRTEIPKRQSDVNHLSFCQERLVFLEKFEQGSSAYLCPYFVVLEKGIDFQRIAQSLNIIVRRHETLRTVYKTNHQGEEVQELLDADFTIETIEATTDEELKGKIQTLLSTPFNLEHEASFKVYHYRVRPLNEGSTEDAHPAQEYLLFLWHHIAFDGWSLDIFLKELAELYEGLKTGQTSQLPELDISYADYAAWQRKYLQGEVLDKHLSYWQAQLDAYETLNLWTDKTRPSHIDYRGQDLHFELSAHLSNELRKLAQEQETTLYTVLLSGFYLCLNVLSGQDDLIVGTPSDNRHHSQTQNLIGFFVNSLALRMHVDAKESIGDFIQGVHHMVSQAKAHQELPFEKLVDALAVERDPSRHPIFQVMFGTQSFGQQGKSDARLPFQPVSHEDSLYCPAKFDLSVFLDDGTACIQGVFNYALSLFEADTIQSMQTRFVRVLENMVMDKDKRTGEMDLLSDKERDQLSIEWNTIKNSRSENKTIHFLFEKQAEQTPDATALVFNDKSLSYRDLNNKANQLARVIRQAYAKQEGKAPSKDSLKDSLVALYLDRGLDMVVAILAVLKAGAAYVPIAPNYPKERSVFILDDTKSAVVVTQQHHVDTLTQYQSDTEHSFAVVDVAQDNLHDYDEGNLIEVDVSPQDLAYVIYTSGTTGKPKGVLQVHQNVHRLFTATQAQFGFNQHDVWTLYHAYTFDFSVWELWGALLHGGQLIIPDEPCVRDFPAFAQLCSDHKVTVLNQTPGAFYAFADAVLRENIELKTLRYVIFGGDKLNIEQLTPWWNHFGDQTPQLVNMYGITETTVHVTYKALTQHAIGQNNASLIGRPLKDMTAHVLNSSMQRVPVGCPGELYIGGAGLARAYLNRAELTAERFIENPFTANIDGKSTCTSTREESRLYKTGDIVRYLQDGSLEYLGRNDSQVKIRGFRIELGEIESALASYSGIQQAVVIDRNDEGNPYLAAYFVTDDHAKVDRDLLHQYLQSQLAEYMLPTTYTLIPSVPLNINGKLNRSALPKPEKVNQDTYIEPSNATEAVLCQIWADILKVERVGIQDNFFRIGGDSILAIRLVAKARSYDIHFQVRDLFNTPTIAELIKYCKTSVNNKRYHAFSLLNEQKKARIQEKFSKGLKDAYPASQLQIGMLLESARNRKAYHDVFNYKINKAFDQNKLREIVRVISEKYEALNQCFIDDEDLGYIAADVRNNENKLDVLDYEIDIQGLVELEHHRSFEFSKAGLYRFIASDIKVDSFRLTFSFHHALLDGWSVSSLISEILKSYFADSGDSFNSEKKSELPLYGEYIKNEREAVDSLDHELFWLEHLADYEEPTYSLSNTRNLRSEKEVNQQAFLETTIEKREYHLSSEQSEAILGAAVKLGVSPDTIFFSLYHQVLCLLQNTNNLVVGIVVNNRLEKEGGDTMPGLFLNTIPLRFNFNATRSLADLVTEVSKTKLSTIDHKAYPYSKIRELVGSPLYDSAFNYVHFHLAQNELKTVLNASDGVLPYERLSCYEKIDIPLLLNVARENNDFLLSASYHRELVNKDKIESLFDYMIENINKLVGSNTKSTLSCLSAKDINTLLKWENRASPINSDKTLHQIFEEQVKKSPLAKAIYFQDQDISYRALNERSNRLARAIRHVYSESYGRELLAGRCIVALYMDRSIDMIVSLLAILKSGAAYLPIDISFPEERIKYLLENSQASFTLTNDKLKDRLTQMDVSCPAIEATQILEKCADTSNENLFINVMHHDLAYVLYTSGTTGAPKGVMISHGASTSRNAYMSLKGDTKSNQYLFKTNYVFDVSISDIFSHLNVGASLTMTESNFDIDEIETLLSEKKVNSSHFVPSQFLLLDEELISKADLKTIYFSGENLGAQQLSKIDFDRTRVVNYYGPTETGEATSYEPKSTQDESIIGKPFDGVSISVVRADGSLAPVGVPGELYIGGSGLALGYLNNDALTKEKFIEKGVLVSNGRIQTQRMYKTGDVVRWGTNGNLEYIGRNDFQVKINGNRIETREIEKVICRLLSIEQAIVRKSNRNTLDAYLITEKPDDIQINHLVEQLEQVLPHFMVPNGFLVIDKVPLTQNGKLDYRALPSIEGDSNSTHVPARNDAEAKMCELWESFLNTESISVTDNFFRLGGNSMLSIRMISAIRREFDIDLSLSDFMENCTVEKLVHKIESNEISEKVCIKADDIEEDQDNEIRI